ncbi:hypothetical protein [Rhizorhapis sp. SPR117]|uniref:hypothetical protein n=1 Tax=Rhizorhapis sp. SPR117 TaxID=2912611 RepID=UPI001F321C76|nr:hypothetical protein [Rhizorhapis sp. SPR117]
MDSSLEKQRRLHFDLTNVGLRAQATAAGLVRLCIELRDANVLTDDALERIKGAIADDVALTAPRGIPARDYRYEIKDRLDLLFTGTREVGSAEALAFGTEPDR